MKVPVYNQKGKEVDKIGLSEKMFDVKMNADLLHQAVCYYEALKRKPIAKTKDRSEVRGGGRKPWKQKGTGRARHGSTRSPIWKGGGVTFGPNLEKKYQKEFPKKMRKKALFITLSQKLKDKEIIFLDKLEIKEPKTKTAAEILKSFKEDFQNKKTAIVLSKKDEKILRAFKNLKNISTILAPSINAYFLLKNKYIIIEREAFDKIKNQKPKIKDKKQILKTKKQ